MDNEIFIPMNVPSSKNSRQIVYVKDKITGKKKPVIIPSKTHKKYYDGVEQLYAANASKFRKQIENLPKPIVVGFRFVRDSKRKFDYINPAQTVQDLMVKFGWIDDDNADEMIPVFLPYEHDKANPGVGITVFEEWSYTK